MMIDRDGQLADESGVDDDVLPDESDELGGGDEQTADEGQDEARAEVEAKARDLGWKPKTDWKGDTSGWVDADEFVTRHKPQRLRETLDRTTKELETLKREREEERRVFEDRLGRLGKMSEKALIKQREQIFAQVKANQRAAAEAGDMEAFDHYQAREQELAAEFQEEAKEFAPPPPRQQQQQAGPDPTVAAWVDANPAVKHNPIKWQAAVAFYGESEAENPGASPAEHLAHVEERLNQTWAGTVRRRAPNGNGRQNGQRETERQRAPQTERSGRMATRSAPTGKGWTDIPSEDRRIIEGHIAEGLYDDQGAKHDPAKARANAAKAYWS